MSTGLIFHESGRARAKLNTLTCKMVCPLLSLLDTKYHRLTVLSGGLTLCNVELLHAVTAGCTAKSMIIVSITSGTITSSQSDIGSDKATDEKLTLFRSMLHISNTTAAEMFQQCMCSPFLFAASSLYRSHAAS